MIEHYWYTIITASMREINWIKAANKTFIGLQEHHFAGDSVNNWFVKFRRTPPPFFANFLKSCQSTETLCGIILSSKQEIITIVKNIIVLGTKLYTNAMWMKISQITNNLLRPPLVSIYRNKNFQKNWTLIDRSLQAIIKNNRLIDATKVKSLGTKFKYQLVWKKTYKFG
jgi:hypothetical protein